jgi:endonuclease YncB( thermonuclease family)
MGTVEMKSICLSIILILTLAAARAAEISGLPEITDGDTVVISGTKLRLLDMDAPESDQFCLNKNSEPWNCGIDAREALKKKADGKEWDCQTTRPDDHGRMLASCLVEKENISQWMVREGWAMSPTHRGYSHRFDADEQVARAATAGLWAGAFIAPWDWRRRNCKTEVRGALSVPIDAQRKLCGSPSIPPDPSCTIKATSRGGQCIYHLDGGYFYGALKMSGNNKRWFCSEVEAQAAGCRRAKR